MPRISAADLTRLTTAIFRSAGAPPDIADQVATSLVESNLVGHDSHGVIRVPAYVDLIRRGVIIPDARPALLQETPTTALVDGGWAFGQVAAHYATEIAIAKARAARVAAVGLTRCNHIGRLGEYAERGAAAGVVLFVFAGGSTAAIAAPYGGAARALGTNPLAVGIPAGEFGLLLLDFATTTVAEGKLQVARAKGERIPEGWILDREGRPTTDPNDFYHGGMLLPFGGHKGYALALLVDALAGALLGAGAFSPEQRGSGTFLLALDATAFQPLTVVQENMDRLFQRIKAVPPAPGFAEVLIPGEPERRTRARRAAEGIPLPDDTWQRLLAVARDLGLETAGMLAGGSAG